jgi:pteridine reductase
LIYDNTQVNKVALVTGASRRIGAAIIMHLHELGYKVAIHCHQSVAEARALAAALNTIRPQSAAVFISDLNLATSYESLINEVIQWGARLDVLVNNASLFLRSDCNAFSVKDWQALFAVNVQAPFALSSAAYPFLSKSSGNIINITDIHAEKPLLGYAAYCQTKAALLMQTRALAREFAPTVRVNAVAPGAIAWPEQQNKLSASEQQKIIAKIPLLRHGAPHYIAEAVISLIKNSYITGQVIAVDGGRSIS